MEQSVVSSIDGRLAKLEDEIQRCEEQLGVVLKKLDPLEKHEDDGTLTDKQEKKLEQLRKEKEQLREKERQLREKELFLRKEKEQLLKPASQVGQLSLGARPSDPELVTLVLQDFSVRDKGPSLLLVVPRGHDFWSEAKELVRREMPGARHAEEVFMCVYERDVEGRVVLKNARAYWRSECISCIFVWWGNKPQSFSEMIDELKEDQKRLNQRMLCLEIISSSALVREKVWADRKVLRLEELEQQFSASSSADVDLDMVRTMIEKLPERPGSENALQKPLFEMLQALRSPTNLWKDWHLRGVQFAGRLHKVDTVLLTRDVEGMEYVDVLFEFKQSVLTDAERRETTWKCVPNFLMTWQIMDQNRARKLRN